jgi:hypothetical protein
MLTGLGLGLLTATWTARHQPWAGLLAATGLALLLLVALLAFRRSRRHAQPAGPRPGPENEYPPESWPDQPPATTLSPAEPPSADFDHWQRQADRTAALEAQIAELHTENSILRADLADALAKTERLASTACKHPAGAIDSGTCRACGTEVW